MKQILLLLGIISIISCTSNQTSEKKVQVVNKDYQFPELPQEVDTFSMQQVAEIHYYLTDERWKTGGDIGLRGETKYNDAAKVLNIPVSKIKAADTFFNYTVLKSMHEWITKKFDTIPEIKSDYYHAIQVSPITGLTTFYGQIMIEYDSRKDAINPEEKAKEIAVSLANTLPDWVSGYKLNWTTVKDLYLETEDDVDIAFLWARGNDVNIMEPKRGTYGGRKPSENHNWHTRNWNNLKPVEHADYKTLNINN